MSDMYVYFKIWYVPEPFCLSKEDLCFSLNIDLLFASIVGRSENSLQCSSGLSSPSTTWTARGELWSSGLTTGSSLSSATLPASLCGSSWGHLSLFLIVK